MTRKTRILLLVAAVLLLLAAALAVWRFCPVSPDALLSATSPESISCGAILNGVQNGAPTMQTVSVPVLSAEDTAYPLLLDALRSTNYRRDLRNLLPFSLGSYDASSPTFLTIVLSESEHSDALRTMVWFGYNTVLFQSSGQSGYSLYHPTDPAAFSRLMDLILQYGTVE